MEQITCQLCGGSPEVERYEIKLSEESQLKLKHNGNVFTDLCIGKEIEFLIKQGVITRGCCCGHGKGKPSCLVIINNSEDQRKLHELGYEIHEFRPDWTKGMFEIYLKTDVQCELRKVLKNKIYNYIKDKDYSIKENEKQ